MTQNGRKSLLMGERLINQGLITPKHLMSALSEQQKSKMKSKKMLGEILLTNGFLKREELIPFLENHLNIKYIQLKGRKNIDLRALRILPERIARQFKMIGIFMEGTILHVAMANPKDIIALDTVKLLINGEVKSWFSLPQEIEKAIDRFYKAIRVGEEQKKHYVVTAGAAGVVMGKVPDKSFWSSKDRVKVKTLELVVFCSQLSTMLKGGVPILRSIEMIASETKDKQFKLILMEMVEDVRNGQMLSTSLKKHRGIFSVLFIAIIEAGEKVGVLDKMLKRLAVYLESRDRLMMKIRTATTYPALIVMVFAVAVSAIMFFIIPKFQVVYGQYGAELPVLTRVIFNISQFIGTHFVSGAIIAIVSSCILFYFTRYTKAGRYFVDSMLLKLPAFGDVIKKAAISKFCRTLSTLLDQGIGITDALDLVGKSSGNMIIEEASVKANKLIMGGETIPNAFRKAGVFPSLMLQMSATGHESGALCELLDQTADFYEARVDAFVSTLTSVIEPILVVGIGAVVAVVVVALYLPIFNLGSVIG